MNAFRQQLTSFRAELHFTQAELARAFDVTVQSVSNWERGRVEPWDVEQLRLFKIMLALKDKGHPARRRPQGQSKTPSPRERVCERI